MEQPDILDTPYSNDQYGRNTIHLDAVKVGDRIRVDLGDIVEFANGIAETGLLQPIVLDDDNNLIAGGRRYAAFKTLSLSNSVFKYIPYTRFGELTAAERRLLELEENIKRKDMTWQERVIGIADYHRLNDLKETSWSQKQTGDMLGVSQANVSIALNLAKMLKDKESPLWKLSSANEAIKFIAAKNLDAGAVEQARRLQAKRAASKSETIRNLPSGGIALTSAPAPVPAGGPVREGQAQSAQKITKEEVAGLFFQGNSLEVLKEIRKLTTINHIICDPPYAINMENLVQDSVSRVAETHRVEPNKRLLREFLQVAFDVIQPDGFLCMWYDLDMHQDLLDWSDQVGWRVCRWPVVWCKSSNCQNQAAQFNITKATEVCLMLRRSEQSVIKTKQHKNWIIADSNASSTHPFRKPDAVWRYLLETVSTENQVVVDPFCGEGSMLLTALRMNRQPLGIELDETHIAHGINWLYEEFNEVIPDMITDESQIPL